MINILTVLVGIATVYVLAVGQRAAIHLASLKTNNFLLPDTNISAVMEFDNTGQIDGRIVATCMIFNTGESLPNVPIITDPIGGNGCKSQNNVVIPNGKTVIRHGVVMYMGRAIVRLTPQALTQIYGGKRKAFTWGIAEYRDQYSFILGPKTTGFCRVLTGNPVNVTWESCGLSTYEY